MNAVCLIFHVLIMLGVLAMIEPKDERPEVDRPTGRNGRLYICSLAHEDGWVKPKKGESC